MSSAGNGSIFSAVDADDAEAFVQKIMRERVTRRPEAHDQHILAVVGQRIRAATFSGFQRVSRL